VIGMTRGYHHGSTSNGVAMFWNLGKESGEWGLTDEQKEALLSYVRDDGKGLIVAHAWGTFDAPVIVEDQTFPAMRHFPKYLRLFDEMYSAKQWSRDKVNVLMRLDESKLNYVNPQYGVERTRPDGRQRHTAPESELRTR
jgi:Trehalose utilisation.